MSKANIFDRRGNLLEEISADFRCTWTINAVDPCAFAYPKADVKNEERIFEFGNWLVVKKGNGLPRWVGKLEPRRQSGLQYVGHSAQSPQVIFGQRFGREIPFLSLVDAAGNIFREILTEANSEEDTLLRPSDIYLGGEQCGLQIRPDQSLAKALERLYKQSGMESAFEPLINGNRLSVQASWRERLGVYVDHSLSERNCEPDEDSMTEEGPIYNMVLGIGTERSDETREYYLARDQASIDRFGLRAVSVSIQAEDQASVKTLTEAELARLAWPRRVFKATATNSDGIYPLLRVGNVFPWDIPVGYAPRAQTGSRFTVRLMGMTHDDKTDGVVLSLKEHVL